ncbi:MAG: NUDIX hydrolase [Ornithinimicrobium sp.]
MTASGQQATASEAEDGSGPTYRDFDVPLSLRADFEVQAARWRDASPGAPAPDPRRAASVLLLREGASGLEFFTQRRVEHMTFAPGMLVYPGGTVDRHDDDQIPWERISPARSLPEWAALMRASEALIRPILCAAARELFEECGVLLAGRDDAPGAVLNDLSHPRWQEHREKLLDRSMSWAELLMAEGLIMRSDLLTPIARWITPECKPHRFDTSFFAATLPPGQHADGLTTEASLSQWMPATHALREHVEGPGTMMTPTQVLAEQVAAASDLSAYFATSRTMTPVLTWPVQVNGRWLTRAPIDASGALTRHREG